MGIGRIVAAGFVALLFAGFTDIGRLVPVTNPQPPAAVAADSDALQQRPALARPSWNGWTAFLRREPGRLPVGGQGGLVLLVLLPTDVAGELVLPQHLPLLRRQGAGIAAVFPARQPFPLPFAKGISPGVGGQLQNLVHLAVTGRPPDNLPLAQGVALLPGELDPFGQQLSQHGPDGSLPPEQVKDVLDSPPHLGVGALANLAVGQSFQPDRQPQGQLSP